MNPNRTTLDNRCGITVIKLRHMHWCDFQNSSDVLIQIPILKDSYLKPSMRTICTFAYFAITKWLLYRRRPIRGKPLNYSCFSNFAKTYKYSHYCFSAALLSFASRIARGWNFFSQFTQEEYAKNFYLSLGHAQIEPFGDTPGTDQKLKNTGSFLTCPNRAFWGHPWDWPKA